MEITEGRLGTIEKPKFRVDRDKLEKSKTALRIYMEILRVKATVKEQREKVTKGILLGSPASYANSKSFVFTDPFLAGNAHIYTILTLEGFKAITFTRTEDGRYMNSNTSVSEIQYIDSLNKFRKEYDPEDVNMRTSAELQGFSHDHVGKEIFRSPHPDFDGFSGLLYLKVNEVPDEIVEHALNSLE